MSRSEIALQTTRSYCACAVALALGLGLTACSTYTPQSLEPDSVLTDFANRSLADPELRNFFLASGKAVSAWPPADWDLDSLTLAAFYFNGEIELAYAQWQSATARLAVSAQRPNPLFNFLPGYNSSNNEPSAWIASLGLDLLFETATKRELRALEASQAAEASRLQLTTAAWQLRHGLRDALIDLQGTGQRRALLQQRQVLIGESVRQQEQQFGAGAISAYELSRARTDLANAQLASSDAERQEIEARLGLARELGVPVSALEGLNLSFTALEEAPPRPEPDARRQALLLRSDILDALAQYAASQTALRLAVAGQYPDFNLGPGYEYDQGDNKWSLGLGLTLPAYHQGQGDIALARARRQEAAARFDALQARVLAEIELTAAGLAAAQDKLSAVARLNDSLQTQLERAQAMLNAGEISRSELTSLRLELSTLSLSGLDARIDAEKLAARMEHAMQSPLDLPESAWQDVPRLVQSNLVEDSR